MPAEAGSSPPDSKAVAFRAALDQLPTGVVISDHNGAVTYMNPAANRMAGGGVRAAITSKALRDLLTSVAKDGQARHRELEQVGPPPQILSVDVRPMDGGGALGLIRDLSELRQLEAVRRDFVANVSHELRTPIGAIAVLADALAQSPDADDAVRLALRARAEADRLTDLVTDLLDLSRIEALRPDENGPAVDLSAVISQSVDRVRHLARAREVSIEVANRAPEAHLGGDESQLVSAVSNLLENAVKYSDQGGSVRLELTHGEGLVEIRVRDEGIGIPAREIDRIFERFYRVDRARARSPREDGGARGGTGLGLSIVRHVAANHGGTIEVQSREGEGSTFVLSLPERSGL